MRFSACGGLEYSRKEERDWEGMVKDSRVGNIPRS
jgi:hypothetical protein